MKINVTYLLSYDYKMFLTSVEQIYDYVDKIIVGIDKDYTTWSGNKFQIPASFFSEVEKFDTRKIISFYYDNFYIQTLSPMECETRERNILLKKLGAGWKMQLDVDEYICDIKVVVKFLRKYSFLTYFPTLTPILFYAKWVTLYKTTSEGFFYIQNNERFPLVTNISHVTKARHNTTIYDHQINASVIHQSWARDSDEIMQKINNWGHKNDFNSLEFFKTWKNLNVMNYLEYTNFHPIHPSLWKEIYFLKSKNIKEFINDYKTKNLEKLEFIKAKEYVFYVLKNIFNLILNR